MKACVGIVLTAMIFLLSQAHAAYLEDARFDKSNQTLTLVVVFDGGSQDHEFSLEWDQCQVLNGKKQIAARLLDSGWDDVGGETIRQIVSFDLSAVDCKPSELTIFSGRNFRRTVWIE